MIYAMKSAVRTLLTAAALTVAVPLAAQPDGQLLSLDEAITAALTDNPAMKAAAYEEKAVIENQQRKMREQGMTLPCGCPGSQSRNIQRAAAPAVETPQAQQTSRLSQWPVQIKLVPVNAPYFDGARLLIAADCTAYAYAAFHERFIKGHITLVGCPKLDSVDYSEKLTEIIRENDIKSVTVVRMEVPCCGGLELAAKKALQQSGKFIPWQVVTVTVDGRLKEE